MLMTVRLQVRVLPGPPALECTSQIPCVPMRRCGREGGAFTHYSQRQPLRPFPRAALPISAKRRAPGREPDPNQPRCFVVEARGCNWSTIRLKVAWSAALRLLRQAPNILLAASAPLSLAFIPEGVIVSL